MATITERIGPGRDLLLLGALAVLGFGVTLIAVWPAKKHPAPSVAMPVKMESGSANPDSSVDFGSPEQLAEAEGSKLSVPPAPTLQELAADSDAGTRDEAQALLALLGEEAVADQQL